MSETEAPRAGALGPQLPSNVPPGRGSSIRIRRGLLSRAESEAEDRSNKAESPLILSSEEDDESRISDTAPMPRRFPSSTTNVTNSAYRQASQTSLGSGHWKPGSSSRNVSGNQSGSGEASLSEGGASLGRAKSISSVSSVNSTSSLEAAPFREAPLGNVRLGFGGLNTLKIASSPETIRPHSSSSTFPAASMPPTGRDPPSVPSDSTRAIGPKNPSKPSARGPNDFHFGETLGEGSYSTVLEAWDLLSGPNPKPIGVVDPLAVSAAAAMVGVGERRGRPKIQLEGRKAYAVKVLDKVHILKQNKQKYVSVEKEALSRLIKHPGVVTLYWTFQDRDSLYYVLELATNGELLGYIRKFGSFSNECASFYAAQLGDTIKAIHEAGIVHRDIKPENILLDSAMRIKVTDFGSAKITVSSQTGQDVSSKTAPQAPERASSFVGTAEYVSPELLAEGGRPAGKPADWWAFGCVVFQMVAGRPPFKGHNEYQTLQKVKNRDFSFPAGFPAEARDLVDMILSLDPDLRPSVTTIFSHPYFKNIDFDALWRMPPPPLETGIAEPIRSLARLPSNSNTSFDEGFVSEQSLEPISSLGSITPRSQDGEVTERRRRSNDADDSDLSDGSSDLASDADERPADRPNSVKLKDNIRRLTGRPSSDLSAGKSPSGSGLSLFGQSRSATPRRRTSALSVDISGTTRTSRDQILDMTGGRASRDNRSPLRTSVNMNQAVTGNVSSSWNALLLPHELMLYSSPVLQKKTGTGKMFSKRRHLIVTDFPRLLCVKETPEALKVKSEVILSLPDDVDGTTQIDRQDPTSSAIAQPTAFAAVHDQPDAAPRAGPNLLTALEYKGGKLFSVKTISKVFVYEVFAGDAGSIVRCIREAGSRR